VPGLSQLLHGVAEQQVGLPDQLVKAVQVPAGTFDILQRLGYLPDRRHGLRTDAPASWRRVGEGQRRGRALPVDARSRARRDRISLALTGDSR
jgi:hypothetical protein